MICDFGCGKEGKYQFKNGKWCCSKSQNSCSNIRNKFSKSGKGKKKPLFSEEHRKKLGSRTKGKKFEEIYGEEKGKKLRDRRREVMISWQAKFLDSFPRDPEKVKKAAKIQSEKIKGDGNPNKLNHVLEKKRYHMLNGGAAKANKGIKNPSKPELKLRNLVKEIYLNCEFQYTVLNYSLDVAIPEYKIAIEYDGSYWHQDKEKDLKRQKEIEKLGWKFIRYVDIIPSKEQLEEKLNKLMEN